MTRRIFVSAALVAALCASGCTADNEEPAAAPSTSPPTQMEQAVASGTIACGPGDAPQIQGRVQGLPAAQDPAVVVAGEPGRTAPRVQSLDVDAGSAAFVVPVRTLDPAALTVTVQDGARVLATVDLTREGPSICG